ncbi:MAG: 7-cyano-7-deazaguanine synthase, partial [Planctomycetia bacterium]
PTTFDLPLRSVYGDHWSTTGRAVPDAASPDEAVFLPGRNVLLLAQTSLWCHLNGIDGLALGILAGNPFPDASAEFLTTWRKAYNLGVEGRLQLLTPYRGLHKDDVLRRALRFPGRLPLGETFSCLRPTAGRHCGQCNKCAERRRAFDRLQTDDPTDYVEPSADPWPVPTSEGTAEASGDPVCTA